MTTVPDRRPAAGLGDVAMAPVRFAMRMIDLPLRAWQRTAGIGGMAGFFLLPNMAIFGVYELLPQVINIIYSTTGGTAIFLPERSFVGAEQYARLFDCRNFLDPRTCVEDAFWTAVGNTFWFVILQVALMIGAALVTALILNRVIAARGFWRAVFFFPVLLSPVVVGLICIAFARQAYSHAESVEMFSAALQGASISAAEAAGTMAGIQAATAS